MGSKLNLIEFWQFWNLVLNSSHHALHTAAYSSSRAGDEWEPVFLETHLMLLFTEPQTHRHTCQSLFTMFLSQIICMAALLDDKWGKKKKNLVHLEWYIWNGHQVQANYLTTNQIFFAESNSVMWIIKWRSPAVCCLNPTVWFIVKIKFHHCHICNTTNYQEKCCSFLFFLHRTFWPADATKSYTLGL